MNDIKKEPLINKRLIDLKEMLERENKLLANRKFIDKLKDKGEKVKRFRDEIEKTIKIKESIEETESFLAKLSLGNKPILPKHPMFSASSDDMRLAKQIINKEPKKNVIREILNEEIDIYSIAISRTFDEDLCQKRSERFIPNRISNKIKDEQKNSKTTEKNQLENVNRSVTTKSNNDLSNESTQTTTINKQTNPQSSNQSDASTSQSNNRLFSGKKKIDLYQKYKDTALEPYDRKPKFISLSIESSLEFGKDQKVKDYEVEKLRLENRLEWRKITEFNSDTSESEELSDTEDMDDL